MKNLNLYEKAIAIFLVIYSIILCSSMKVCAYTAKDIQPPSAPTALTVYSTDYTTISLTWDPSSDNAGVKGYEIYNGDKKITSTSDTYYVCKGLTPGKTYTFSVKAHDIAGNFSTQSTSITSTTVPDNSAPSTPAGLKASSVTYTSAKLEWSASSDNVKVKVYEIFCNGVKAGTTAKTEFAIKNLFPGNSYSYAIRAIDTVGNVSQFCTALKVIAQKDLQVPTAPTGLNAVSASGTSISLTWNASTDNVKVKGYQIFCNGYRIATTTRTSFTVKSPVGHGRDVYCVKAYDLVGNVSASSNSVTAVISK